MKKKIYVYIYLYMYKYTYIFIYINIYLKIYIYFKSDLGRDRKKIRKEFPIHKKIENKCDY